MKHIIIMTFSICLGHMGFSQPCTTLKIQTPVVQRPVEIQSVTTNNCDVIRINWKGAEHQTYVIAATSTDASGKTSPVQPSTITYDKEFNCSVALPLNPGATLAWSIQAIETIDGRTFYSYPLRGESPACEQQLIVEAAKTIKPKTVITFDKNAQEQELTVYPNPVTGELTINWTSEYKGNAKLTIMDAAGKPIKSMPVTKAQSSYSHKLNVTAFSAGLYYLYINMQSGKSVSTKFVKK